MQRDNFLGTQKVFMTLRANNLSLRYIRSRSLRMVGASSNRAVDSFSNLALSNFVHTLKASQLSWHKCVELLKIET